MESNLSHCEYTRSLRKSGPKVFSNVFNRVDTDSVDIELFYVRIDPVIQFRYDSSILRIYIRQWYSFVPEPAMLNLGLIREIRNEALRVEI